MKRAIPKPARREIFVLTPEEKKTLGFVLVALALGLVTMHFRATHPIPSPKTEMNATPSPASTQTRGKPKQTRRAQ
ncbi:MAG: hypothetical protein DLM73_13490 [Chthoniobacterales bacterium]|nr:MAG: hypothetical protein DLM73_13490 [Chthoniobacterales bacterium]